MIEWISQFWTENSGSIIISFGVGFVFFVLGPLGLWFSGKRIRRERVRKAKEHLLDLLEGMIVNKSGIDERKLLSIFRAVERDIDIDLSGEYNLESWLGDVVLRFEKSRLLSAEQKREYYETVESGLDELKAKKESAPKEVVPRKYEELFEQLNNSISAGDSEQAIEAAREIESNITRKPPSQDPLLNIFKIYHRLYQKSPFTFTLAIVIVTVIYVLIIMRYATL